MNTDVLQQQLDAFLAYAEGDVLLWHDPMGACSAALDGIALPPDVVLMREDTEPRFSLKQHVNDVEPDERVLLYRQRHHRVEAGDWFADLETRAPSFEAAVEDAIPASAPAPMQPAEPKPVQEPLPSTGVPALGQDFYTPEEFRAAALEALGEGAAEQPDELLASRLGFVVHRDCVIRGTWSSPAEYYSSLMQGTLVAKDTLPAALVDTPSFYQYCYQRELRGELLAYDEGAWITPAGLHELEISEEDIASFAQDAERACERAGVEHFTITWLRSSPESIPLLSYELSTAFYESVLAGQEARIGRGKLGGARIFSIHGAKARGRDFVASVVRQEAPLQMDDLEDILNNDYGISLSRSQLVQLVRAAGLYYSPEIGRVYVSYEQSIREVE